MSTEQMTLYEYYNPKRYISRSFHISQAKMWLRAVLKGHYAIEVCLQEMFGIVNRQGLTYKEVGIMMTDVSDAYEKVLRIRELNAAMHGDGRKNQYHEILAYHRKMIGKSPFLFGFFTDEFIELMEGVIKQSVPFTSDRL